MINGFQNIRHDHFVYLAVKLKHKHTGFHNVDHILYIIKASNTTIAEFANTVDHNEPFHLYRQLLPSSL